MAISTTQDTLYFDGKCPLCAHEIRLLSKLKRSSLALQDIHQLYESTEISKLDMLSILHLRTVSGEWLKGLDATVSAWNHTPIGFVFKPLRWPLIRSVADRLYYRWASNRACKLGY